MGASFEFVDGRFECVVLSLEFSYFLMEVADIEGCLFVVVAELFVFGLQFFQLFSKFTPLFL